MLFRTGLCFVGLSDSTELHETTNNRKAKYEKNGCRWQLTRCHPTGGREHNSACRVLSILEHCSLLLKTAFALFLLTWPLPF